MAVDLEQQREIREYRRGTWDGTEEQARIKYESHPQMQELFPTFEDYLNYLGAYQQRLQELDEATTAFEENIQNFTPTEYDQEAVNNFDINTDYTGPVGLDAIREALAGVEVPDAAAMDVAFGSGLTYEELQNEYGLTGNTERIREGDYLYVWNGTEFEKRDLSESFSRKLIKAAIGAGFALGLGPVVGSALGLGGTGVLGSAVSAGAGSAIGQAVVTGSVDMNTVAISAITGGIQGLGEAVRAGDLAGTALDNAIWDLSDTLGVDFETTASILEGAAAGAVAGEDIEGVVAGAVGGWTNEKLKMFADENFGDVLDVDNIFREGSTSIDREALYPLIDAGIQAAVEGGLSAEDALLTTVDYFAQGGSLDFLLPALPSIAEGYDLDLSALLPDIDFDLGFDLPDVDLGLDLNFNNPLEGWDPNINNPFEGFDPNINNPFEGFDPNINLPPIDLPPIDLPPIDLPPIDLPPIDVNLPELPELPEFNVDVPELPDVNIDIPELPELPEVNIEPPEFDTPEGPELPEGPDLPDVPDVDLPSLPFGSGDSNPAELPSIVGGLFGLTTIGQYRPKPLPEVRLDAARRRRGMFS